MSTIFSCCNRIQIKVVSISTGLTIKSIPNKIPEAIDAIITFTISHGDNVSDTLITAHSSGLLNQYSWRPDPPQIMRSWKSFHSGPVNLLKLDPTEGILLASGGSDSLLKVWDTKRQYCTHNLKGAVGVITAIAFQPLTDPEVDKTASYKILASGDQKPAITVWNLITSKGYRFANWSRFNCNINYLAQ